MIRRPGYETIFPSAPPEFEFVKPKRHCRARIRPCSAGKCVYVGRKRELERERENEKRGAETPKKKKKKKRQRRAKVQEKSRRPEAGREVESKRRGIERRGETSLSLSLSFSLSLFLGEGKWMRLQSRLMYSRGQPRFHGRRRSSKERRGRRQ